MTETVRIVVERFRETEEYTFSAFPARDKRRRDIARLFVISRLSSSRALFDFLAVFRRRCRLSALASRPKRHREGEKMEIRGECDGERRAINGIRIGRVPRIACQYCVIAVCTRAYETTRHAHARACVRKRPSHDCARGLYNENEDTKVSLTYFSIFSNNRITKTNYCFTYRCLFL